MYDFQHLGLLNEILGLKDTLDKLTADVDEVKRAVNQLVSDIREVRPEALEDLPGKMSEEEHRRIESILEVP